MIYSVNVTKSAVSCGFGQNLLKKSLMENYTFSAVYELAHNIMRIPHHCELSILYGALLIE